MSAEELALRALKTAIGAEKKSLRTYLEFALHTDDASGKNTFIRLAHDEFEHMDLLERQAENIQECGDWLKLEIEASDVELIVPRLSHKDVKVRGTSGQDQLAALRIALALEKRAHDFYAAQTRNAADPNAQEMYHRLAEMEEAHYELIQTEIDTISRTGFWFGLREFSLEIE
jgi:rubrerythrin